MAFTHVITALLFALALSCRIEPTACQVVKGKVSCLDCDTHHNDLSGIKISVKCANMKELATATTEIDGYFETELPSADSRSSSLNCLAQLLGGPSQLYATRKDMVSLIVKGKEPNSYTISTTLSFLESCPANTKCIRAFGSSEAVNLPLPPEWGLAPSSYYIPFFPIIGIP